jgi:DMSO reductase anchor subunit
MQTNHASEFSLAMTAIAVGVGGLMKVLVAAEPVLASLSYLVAMIAGIVTIYYKFKRKG